MVDYKQIEKIHPMILFLIFTIGLSSILPIFFLVPLPQESQPFNNAAADGSIQYQLSGDKLLFTFTINKANTDVFSYTLNSVAISISVNKNELVSFNYLITNESLTSIPLAFHEIINLTQSDVFTTSFTIESRVSINQNTPVYESFVLESFIGRIDYPLYDKWFIITALSCISLFIVTALVLKQKESLNFPEIIKSYFYKKKYSYSAYESMLPKINDSFYFIFYMAPAIFIFVLMYQIYFTFSTMTHTLLFIFNYKYTVAFVIALHSFLILTSPAILNTIVDEFKGSRLLQKNRIKDNLIFTPFLMSFYFFLALILRFFPSKILFAVCIGVSFIVNTLFYFLSMVHHSWKFKYSFLSTKKLFFYALSYRIVYTILVQFIILFFIYSTTPYPVYLLLF